MKYDAEDKGETELEVGEDVDLTEEELDIAADLLIESLAEGADEEHEYEIDEREYEREGGVFGFVGRILLGRKVPEPGWKVGLKGITRLVMWLVIGGVVLIVLWFAFFKKKITSGF